ncbi:hypothetical protein E2C01_012012 [Portunus trituberculatus]|uniref:Uncharacterized protein n=1 Tax=Portunus trituberculatus TaxID=210409 RepID=A0A5B7DCS8_PORTR|nr:hypothetical protein [Portunus trituberculatus]
MHKLVAVEVTLLSELLPTILAFKLFLISMNNNLSIDLALLGETNVHKHMTVQVVFHSKSLVTELTLEQLLPVVFLQVAIEVTFHSKTFATVRAQVKNKIKVQQNNQAPK